MFFNTGDAEIHYDVHGDGEPLLWLHGGLGHGADWTFIFKEPPAGFQLSRPTCVVTAVRPVPGRPIPSNNPRPTCSRCSIICGSSASK